ncbi:MAG TPA: hypothetical protein VHW71_02125 [Steroidobacteraceae bacterium]|nr:hypothetical protein [Steroidobacteraceae bacterium]
MLRRSYTRAHVDRACPAQQMVALPRKEWAGRLAFDFFTFIQNPSPRQVAMGFLLLFFSIGFMHETAF